MAVRGPKRNDEKWMQQFAAYKKYVAEHRQFPPAKVVVDGFPLGQWFRNLIRDARSGDLPEDRLALMDAFHPAWKEPYEVRSVVARELLLTGDWKVRVPEGDTPLDVALSGNDLTSCVQHNLYGCQQYLSAFEKATGGIRTIDKFGQKSARQFWDIKMSSGFVDRYGESVFCLENRRKVFQAAFPRLDFGAFNIVFGALNGYSPVWGFGKSYVDDARLYNARCKFQSPDEMMECVYRTLWSLKGREPEVLIRRRVDGLSHSEIGEQLSLTRERIRQIERDGLRHMRHPSRSTLFAPFSDIELLKEGRGDCLSSNTTFEGDVDLKDSQCDSLPEHLMVKGFLDLENTPIRKLPKRLWVGGDLVLSGTQISELPEDLVVRGNLLLPDKIMTLPDSVRISGWLRQKLTSSLEAEDALTSVTELGLSAETVDVLVRNGVRTKMDLLDLEDVDALLRNAKNKADARVLQLEGRAIVTEQTAHQLQ